MARMEREVVGGQVDHTGIGLKAVKIDKHGPQYRKSDIVKACMGSILADSFFNRKAKVMTTDVERAIEQTEGVTVKFSATLDKFLGVERNFAEQSKRVSGNVRDAGEKLAQGLARIEKAANFDRLERYVDLLERAATAMKSLAELEATGTLEKIAGAIR